MTAPAMSVVIGFRDWGVERLRRSVTSLHDAFGTVGGEIIVSDYGSVDPGESKAVADEAGARWVHTPGDPVWSRSRALNAGFAVAGGELLISTDADMLFAPGTLEVVHAQHLAARGCALFLQCRDLPESVPPALFDDLGTLDWPALDRKGRLRPRWGMGGMMAIDREGFTRLHGFDERLHTYGREDIDFARRARRAGWRTHWVEDPRARMFHMWHPPTITTANASEDGQAAVRRNRYLVDSDLTVSRNLRSPNTPLPSARPLVSIVVLREDGGPVERTVATALAQTVQDVEVLVAHENGTGTPTVAEDARLRCISVPEGRSELVAALDASRGVHVAIVRAGELLPLERTEQMLLALSEGAAGVRGREVRLLADGRPVAGVPTGLQLSHLLMRRDELRTLLAGATADLDRLLARTGLDVRSAAAPVLLTRSEAAADLEQVEELPEQEAAALRALAIDRTTGSGRRLVANPAPPAEVRETLEGRAAASSVHVDGVPLEDSLQLLDPTDADLVRLARTGAHLSLSDSADEGHGPAASGIRRVLEHARRRGVSGPAQISILRDSDSVGEQGPIYTLGDPERSPRLRVDPVGSDRKPRSGLGAPWILAGVRIEEVWS